MHRLLYSSLKWLFLPCAAAFFASCSSDSQDPHVETAQNYQVPANYQYPDSATVVSVLTSGSWKEVRSDNVAHIMRFEQNGSFQDNLNWNFGPHFFKWTYQDSARLVYLHYELQDTTVYLVDKLEMLQLEPSVFFYQVERRDEAGNIRKVKALFRKQLE